MKRIATINEPSILLVLPPELVNLIIELIGKESSSTIKVMPHINKTFYGLVSRYASINKISRRLKCHEIASEGYLEVLKWARENGCDWNSDTCSFAADNGHLEVLKWARENGCKWNFETCRCAALNGHIEVLKWARENGCDWDSKTEKFAKEKWPKKFS